MKKILLSIAVMSISAMSMAQDATVESILDTYFENTGGRDAWNALEGYKMTAGVSMQGMDIPLEIYSMKDGRAITTFSVMGMDLAQDAFDGEVAWGTNFQSMSAEKSDSEQTENVKRESKDYPDPFLNYEENGYSVELMENENVDGIDCFVLKLTKGTTLVDEEEMENISYFYFDTENYVPVQIKQEMLSGEMAGEMSVTTFSDYQEVDGLYFPFSITQGLEDGEGQTVEITEVELNPEVEDSLFAFPGE
ncbi:MAG: outer membrane lipoprotein-sorting protein [Flavobacteriaceae bacterium]|jgi:outer membrane lipoprotein-sorting protein